MKRDGGMEEGGVHNEGFRGGGETSYLPAVTHVRRPNESKSDKLCCLAQHLRLRTHREFAHLQPDHLEVENEVLTHLQLPLTLTRVTHGKERAPSI